MYLESLQGCQLIIGSYPPFNYDATGGGGKAIITSTDKDNLQHLCFSPKTFSIPPLTSKTTRFLLLPLPPGIKIEMVMDILEGTVDKKSGRILLRFESRFVFTIGSIFRFPDLIVKTALETGKVKGDLHESEGLTLQNDGRTTLVGIAKIPKTGQKILDLFLGLPNEALAVLQCKIK